LRKYHVNQLVRVRNREDINKTLDKDGKCEGCFFMNQMYTFCGREFIILKVLSNYWYGLMFKTRPGLYILEGLHCDGVVEGFDQTCDGACLLIWHEKWLEKAN
jgi:hypothetical protein